MVSKLLNMDNINGVLAGSVLARKFDVNTEEHLKLMAEIDAKILELVAVDREILMLSRKLLESKEE